MSRWLLRKVTNLAVCNLRGGDVKWALYFPSKIPTLCAQRFFHVYVLGSAFLALRFFFLGGVNDWSNGT